MLEAFILGFWTIWSSNRDIYALTESLGFYDIGGVAAHGHRFSAAADRFELGHQHGFVVGYVGLSFWVVTALPPAL